MPLRHRPYIVCRLDELVSFMVEDSGDISCIVYAAMMSTLPGEPYDCQRSGYADWLYVSPPGELLLDIPVSAEGIWDLMIHTISH